MGCSYSRAPNDQDRDQDMATLVGDHFNEEIVYEDGTVEIRNECKWWSAVCGSQGCIYGIPYNARRIVKYNPVTEVKTSIGPDFGDDECKWIGAVMDDKGCIYCAPFSCDVILKIDTTNDTVSTIESPLFNPGTYKWSVGSLALDGNIYFMPCHANRIMKVNCEFDTASMVGGDLGDSECKYFGSVVDHHGYVVGIPHNAKHVVRYNPATETTDKFIYDGMARKEMDVGNGVLGRDGCIYAVNPRGQVVKFDHANRCASWTRGKLSAPIINVFGWINGILGIDGCIYWPPRGANRILKYDPFLGRASLVGAKIKSSRDDGIFAFRQEFTGGVMGHDGIIYCIPYSASQVLKIDPLAAFVKGLKADMELYPERLGLIFEKKNGAGSKTAYESALAMYAEIDIFQIIVGILTANKTLTVNQLFLLAASYPDGAVSVVYYWLRLDPCMIESTDLAELK